MGSRRIGNYLVLDYIGSGGFGSVFKAEDVNTPGRIVAIKELHKKHTRSAVIKQRFFQEAVAMARLDHPNLPRLYTFGEDNGSYYLVMEFISGKLLSEEIHDKGPIQPQYAISIMSQMLDAVSYAHRNGIIHRDLKPENIILIDDGQSLKVKVLDFGIARMVGGENLTLAGEGFGTPTYMSPERITGGASIDHRTDIYSAGIILYEILSGQVPFESKASDPSIYWSEMRNLHGSAPLPPLSSLGIPAELENVMKKATAKRVEDRYSTADEMLAELKSAVGDDASNLPRRKLARLALTTVPGAAEVFVDNTRRGTSDAIRGKILIDGLTPGLHSVRVTKAGYSEYKINVSLEEGGQTDFQVALAARATVAVPPQESTAPVDLQTRKIEVADEMKTALLLVEGLPTGSKVFVGSEAVAQAGEDGRATVKLKTGVHELQVTAPSGAAVKEMVTVTDRDSGSLKIMTIPLEQNRVVSRAVKTRRLTVTQSEASSTGKRMAMAATVVLLLALAAAAYFVLRGPARRSAQVDSLNAQANQSAAAPAETEARAAEAAALKLEDEVKQKEQEIKEREQALKEKERALKEAAQAEKRSEDKMAATEEPAEPQTPAQPVTQPEPTKQAQNQNTPSRQDACVGVFVTGRDGQPMDRLKLALIEQPDSSTPTVHRGRPGPNGGWIQCGLTSGNRVRLVAYGPGGDVLGSRQTTLAPGKNLMEIHLDQEPETPPPFGPRGRRPKWPRP